jgi:uncharacterized membrane protein (DUF2068 family)
MIRRRRRTPRAGHELGNLPGTTKPSRLRPRFAYELIVCGLRGHELVGTDAASIRPEDALVVRCIDGWRWHRCLRCDSWLPLPPPLEPQREYPPGRDEIELPLRGKPLRDKVVLRLIALDRALHFVVLGLLAAAIFLFAAHEDALRRAFYRITADVQGGVGGGPIQNSRIGIVHELDRLFSLSEGRLALLGAAVAAYAALEGTEAVGLWFGRRWAEYLTFVATIVFVPFEVWELTRHLTWFKIVAFVVNVAIAVYLLLAKRLFGLRGGAAADQAERARDVGWPALERAAPQSHAAPQIAAPPAAQTPA